MIETSPKFKILRLYLRNDIFGASLGIVRNISPEMIYLSKYGNYTLFLQYKQIRHIYVE